MNKTIFLITRIILIIAFVLAVVFQAGIMFTGGSEGFVMNFIIATEVFFALAILLGVIVFPVDQIIQDPKSAVKPLIIVGCMVVLFIVSYLFASTSMTQMQLDKFQITTTVERLVETGLIITYILFFVAIGALIVTGIRSMIKK